MTALQAKEYYRANREYILSRNKRRYARHRKLLKAQGKARWLKKSPEERKYLQRRRSVKSHYRLTAEAHDAMLARQNYRCPISGRVVDIYSAIDHDHRCCPGEKSCGKCTRAILHRPVNAALSAFERDPESLLRAYEYLRSFDAK